MCTRLLIIMEKKPLEIGREGLLSKQVFYKNTVSENDFNKKNLN